MTNEQKLSTTIQALRACQREDLRQLHKCQQKYENIIEFLGQGNSQARVQALQEHIVEQAREGVQERIESLKDLKAK